MTSAEIVLKIKSGNYKKINIVGSPGSGKSSLAHLIGQNTRYQIYDLDDFLYSEDGKCKRKNVNDTDHEIDKILSNNRIIIDGTYTSSLQRRLEKIDLVILVDTPQIIAIFRFFKRLLSGIDLKCGERLTLKTFILIFTFGKKSKNKIKQLAFDNKVDLMLCKKIIRN